MNHDGAKLSGKRERQKREGIKCYTLKMAVNTFELRANLSMEKVHNDGAISFAVIVPVLSSNNRIRTTIAVLALNVRLDCYSIEILVETIKEKCQELLRVVLHSAIKLWSVLDDGFAELHE